MSVKTNHSASSRNGSNKVKGQSLPKSLGDINKHFRLWNQSKGNVKLNLKQKFIQPIKVEGLYAKLALKQLADFGKLYQRKVHAH